MCFLHAETGRVNCGVSCAIFVSSIKLIKGEERGDNFDSKELLSKLRWRKIKYGLMGSHFGMVLHESGKFKSRVSNLQRCTVIAAIRELW